jgi:hypothetical protein
LKMQIVEYQNQRHYVVSVKRVRAAPIQWEWAVRLACLQDKTKMINKGYFEFSDANSVNCPYCKNIENILDTPVKMEYE